jgi:hypothetical protein
MEPADTASVPEKQDIKIQPANRAILKTLKDLSVKKARAEHHRSLLTSAITEGRTIGGLRREVRPQVPDIPVDFAIEWEEAHITFTDSLTKLLAKYWSMKKESIEKEIAATTEKLFVGTSELEKTHITSLATDTFNLEVTKLEAPKPQRPPRKWLTGKRRKAGDFGPGPSTGK